MKRELILSIETAVNGGSLSLLANRNEIGGWHGTLKISKAEDVLEQISKLLNENSIEKTHLETIGVSKGAGSLTGEKIGLALARGLAKSLSCRLLEVDVFESLLTATGNLFDGEYLTAVPTGKNHAQWQKFRIADGSICKIDKLQNVEKEEFFKIIKLLRFDKIISVASFRDLYDDEIFENYPQIEISSDSLAKLNGLQISRCCASDNAKTIKFIN